MSRTLPPAADDRATRIERHILVMRGQRIMLDSSLAALYQVTTGNLNLAVRRNRSRFPPDFLFALTAGEAEGLLLQNAIANKRGRGGRRSAPIAFTELGVAMLSSLLKSERAVAMNIRIMRAFVRLRESQTLDPLLNERFARLEREQRRTGRMLDLLVREILEGTARKPRRIGFAAGKS